MRKKGQKYDIVDEGAPNGPHQILRSDYIAKVKTLLRCSQGRELPGTFDPLIIGQLFYEQREPWSAIFEQIVEKVLHAVSLVVKEALAQVADATTAQGMLRTFVYPRLTKVTTALRAKVSELLRLHEAGHPITYNHYLTENV
ncbi:hypothetical protein J1614_003265 [Plenodomus biglobosus]|nr:hypothetical protein J1614_003265 [Plenodomus biglobosus]